MAGKIENPVLAALREKHRAFRYRSYRTEDREDGLKIVFDFLLEPDLVFRPQILVPALKHLPASVLERLVFNLGLVEAISYWKAACPAEIIVEAGALSGEEASFWQDLFLHGLGEFYCRNNIDFSAVDFLSIRHHGSNASRTAKLDLEPGDLILSGGGKDSAVTLELLKGSKAKQAAFVLNPIRAALDAPRLAGYPVLLAERAIDPLLLSLNAAGYLNGHTPFSAYLAFLSALVAALNGFDTVVVSNESSANEENTFHYGLPVNHQYSKSLRFETMFREYASSFLPAPVNYFSFLRPLSELQVCRLFSRLERQMHSFRSCNVNQKQDSWCGACAKCAFVYLCLFPFTKENLLQEVFGADLFARPQIQPFLRQLTGLESVKPFECVGTEKEACAAVCLAVRKYSESGAKTPPLFANLHQAVVAAGKSVEPEVVLASWDPENFLAEPYLTLLRNAII